LQELPLWFLFGQGQRLLVPQNALDGRVWNSKLFEVRGETATMG